jgi:23S rRNA pseudouridine2605 synthase
MEERLQKILARAGIASRRKVEEMIQQGLVTVNGQVAAIGDKADPEHDAIKVEGRRIQPHTGEYHYLLLNKPKGVMSTLSDPEGRPTVLDFIPPTLRKALVPVGRLDYYTEGLLLLTDDGEFAQRVAHPRYGSVKTYEVKVKGRPAEAALDRLRAGISLEGRKTAPAQITSRLSPVAHRHRNDDDEGGENTWWIVRLTEGRTRQIREMFQHIGHPVQKLRRVSIGPLRDPDLPLGAVRELTSKEVQSLLRHSEKARPVRAPKKPAPKPASVRGPAAKGAPAKKAPAKRPVSGKAVAKRSPHRPGKSTR